MHGPERKIMRKHRLRTLLGAKTAAREVANRYPIEEDFEHRIRLMLRYRWLVLISATLLVIGLTATVFYFLAQPARLRIAVGPAGSDDSRLIQFLGTKFARDNAPIRLRIAATESSAQSAEMLDTGFADLAVVRQDLAFPKNGAVVAVLRKNYAVLFAPGELLDAPVQDKTRKTKPPRIEKIEDLAGKRIGVVGRSQANVALLKVILEQYEVPFDKVQIVHLSTTEVANAIRTEKPDAILTVGPLGSRITTDAIAALVAITPNRKPPTFLPIGSSEAIAERFPAYETGEIAKGAFGGSPSRPAEELETVMVSHFLVAANSLSDATVGELAKLLLSSRQTLSSELIGFAKIEKPDTDKDANVAVHPGAKAWFDDEQKSFFEKYGDHLFWLFMVVPLLGSGAAGIASYMKAGERTHHVRLLNKLLDISRRAHSVETMQALDTLQEETDELVIQTVHRAERSALGESPQLSFMLAIEQARFAIADRRAILIAQKG
jgi:TRAP transporter TAXI family solute receptor